MICALHNGKRLQYCVIGEGLKFITMACRLYCNMPFVIQLPGRGNKVKERFCHFQ